MAPLSPGQVDNDDTEAQLHQDSAHTPDRLARQHEAEQLLDIWQPWLIDPLDFEGYLSGSVAQVDHTLMSVVSEEQPGLGGTRFASFDESQYFAQAQESHHQGANILDQAIFGIRVDEVGVHQEHGSGSHTL